MHFRLGARTAAKDWPASAACLPKMMSLLQVPHAGKRWMVGFRRQAAAELTSLGGQNDVIA
jgi:hypothetical protein